MNPNGASHLLRPSGTAIVIVLEDGIARRRAADMGIRMTSRIGFRDLLILWLFLLSAVGFMDRTNISIAGPAIRSELRLDDVHLGWVFSAFLVGYAAFQVVGGWLAYRFGPRLVLAAGVLWWGLFTCPPATRPARSPEPLPRHRSN